MKTVKPFAKKLVINKETIRTVGVQTHIQAGRMAETCGNACMTTTNEMCGSACGPCSACG